jgi:hypothetical protein
MTGGSRSVVRVALVVLISIASALVFVPRPVSAGSSDAIADCPVTPYSTRAPSAPETMGVGADGQPVSFTPTWYGNDALWAGVSPSTGGRWFADKDGLKVLWYREISGQLTIEGKRLDASAPPLETFIPSGYGERGIQATGLRFPTDGCWEVVGRVGASELRFVVYVLPEELDPLVSGGIPPPGPDVWASLRRPVLLTDLRPGDPCPAAKNNGAWSAYHTAGDGPVYAAGAAGDGLLAYNLGDAVEGRGVAKGSWAVSPDYAGPILIRGRQIDGSEVLRFGPEATGGLTDELHLAGSGEVPNSGGWRSWGLETFLRKPGCYAVQIDGWNFSESIVLGGVGPDATAP